LAKFHASGGFGRIHRRIFSMMPIAVQEITRFVPLTYVANLLRGLWAGQPWSAFTTEVSVLVSVKTFRWE